MIRHKQWKYMYCHSAAELLFHLDDDPQEMHNLVQGPAHADIVKELQARILANWNMEEIQKYLATL